MFTVNVIRDKKNTVKIQKLGNAVIETCLYKGNPGRLFYRILFPQERTVRILGKEEIIPAYVEIQNAVWESRDFFYPVISDAKEDRFKITIMRYTPKAARADSWYSFEETGAFNTKAARLKVFVLSSTCLLIQKELLDDNSPEMRMGHIRFLQKIVDLETGNETVVTDENIKNNGLNCMIPVSASNIMIKTGFNYLEDDRFAGRSETEALIESVFIHTTSRFIADLSIGATATDANLIRSAYYKQYILKPEFKDSYIHFIMIEPDTETSVAVFYNVQTAEQLSCKNESPDFKDLSISYVIADTPYVKNTATPETRFLNLKTMEFDLSAMGEEFAGISGELFVTKTRKGNREPSLVFYHYPDMTRVLKEKGSLFKGCKIEDDYYIYLQK